MLEPPLDLPFFPLLLPLSGELEAVEVEPPDAAPLDDKPPSEDGADPVLEEGGFAPVTADGGAELSEALVTSGVALPDDVPEFAFEAAPLGSVEGVDGGVGVWAEF